MAKKPYLLRDLMEALETLWPLSGAMEWDNPGLIAGDLNQPVDSILLAVDAVRATADEAVSGGFSVLLTHHPLLFNGVTSVVEQSYQGAVLSALIRSHTALIAAHTNADVVPTGTSAVLAKRLDLKHTRVLDPAKRDDTGIGIVGELKHSLTLAEFAGRVADILPVTAGGIRVSGDADQLITKVALCAGAGDSYLRSSAVREADVYLTSDLRHHPAQENVELAKQGIAPALIDISHWAAESLWLEQAALELENMLPGITIAVSKTNTDPWDFLVIQHEG